MDVTELTTAAGWIAGLAILALIASGWRKPARATANTARAEAKLVDEKAPLAEHNPFWRRVWSVVAASALALWVAAIVATAVAFGMAWIVITLSDMLKK